MATLLQQTRTTRSSGTRVVTSSSSIGSLRSAAKTPVQQDAKAKQPVSRDSRASRTDFRSFVQKDPRSKTPVLREPRSRRDLAAAVAAAAAVPLASIASAPPTPPPHSPAFSTLSISNVSGLRSPSPGPPLDGMLEGPSPLALFVMNLKLLNFDSLPDWPRININTFVPPGPGTQGQKRRIHCAEWVLFQLFSLWDPEETESRLRPLYPPQDADQSAEYRAALFKALERAKKMGALSRDAIVRKSALDDCKADRLEEILASFSTTVLKKVVLERLAVAGARPDSILGYATQNLGRQADRSELTAMTMAYRSSIKKMLGKKAVARDRFGDFADLLHVKEQETARRHEAILAKEIKGTGQPVSHNARAEMRRTLRNNWSGDEAWMEALFSGDPKAAGLMTRPFDEVWHGLQRGRLGDLETEETGLLQQLESRVEVQKERLQKWKVFRKDTFGRTDIQTPSHAKSARTNLRGIDLGFENHMNLQVGKMARLSLKSNVSREPGMSADYARLVSSLNQDLARISRKDMDLAKLLAERLPKKEAKPHRRHRSTFSTDGDDVASEISDLDDAEKTFSAAVPRPTSFPDRLTGSCGSSLRPKLSRPDLTSIAVEGSSGPAIPLGKLNFPGKSAYDIDQFDLPEPPTPPREVKPVTPPSKRRSTASASPRDVKSGSPTSKRRSSPPSPGMEETRTSTPSSKSRKPRRLDMNTPSNPLVQDQVVMSPSQYFADEDVPERVQGVLSPSSLKDSPMPMRRSKPRHTLSLLERKQLSLSRKSSFFLEDDEPDLIHEPSSICGSTAEHTAEEDSKESSGEMTDEQSARAPCDNADHEPIQEKPPHQLRRSHRRAMTLPQKQTILLPEVEADAEEGGERLLERLTMEQDYEAVFRSRPKIAQNSPVKGYGLSDYFA